MPFTVPPVVESGRLRLRGWRMEDFDGYAQLRGSAEDQAYTGGAVSRDQAWKDFCAKSGEWQVRGMGVFIVADRATDKGLGYAGLWYPPFLSEPELCWSLFPGNTGRGYATEAAQAARDWAYEALGLKPLMSFVHHDNLPSRAVAERLGAEIEGEGELYGVPRVIYRHKGPE